MDLSIQLKNESGAICTLSLSFNNNGPFGTFSKRLERPVSGWQVRRVWQGSATPIW